VKLAVIGTGHVGLVTGAALAGLGHDVVGMDVSADKIAGLQQGVTPFREPGLDDLLRRGLDEGRLAFTTSIAEAVTDARAVFVCVGRPPVGQGDRSLTAVEDAAREIARAAADGVLLVVKSTVPPGTTGRIEKVVRQERPDLDAIAVSSPEFLREGYAIEDTLEPDRLVLGADDERADEVFAEIYAPLLDRGVPLVRTDPRSAELAKLASNAFLATKLSFVNALARMGERCNADADDVAAIMGADPRIGHAFLAAGMGYGGYCLPKDVATLERVADRLGYDFGLLRETARINDEAIETIARTIEEAVWNLEGKTVALLGLAFKSGTDDVRGAPALALAERLAAEGAAVTGYDPMAGPAARSSAPAMTVADDAYQAASAAHCAVICTEWPEFLDLDLARLKGVMAQPVIVDGRNLLDEQIVREAGFQYVPVGRRPLGG
jgi:UDPglucose 6-dehydrogenase